jgi:anti-anti-sigma factor
MSVSLSMDVRTGFGAEMVVAVRGEIDHATIDRFRDGLAAALAQRPQHLCVDLGLVSFMDSMGFSALVVTQRAAMAAGARFSVTNPSPFVYRALHIMGLLDQLNVTPVAPPQSTPQPGIRHPPQP